MLDVPLSSTTTIRKCRLVRRYKRFLADVVFPEDDDGSDEPSNVVTVHCPNTGPMTGLLGSCPRAEAWVSVADDDPRSKRKYKHTLEAIRPSPSEAVVGVHSAAANRVVRALLEAGVLSEGGGGGGGGGGVGGGGNDGGGGAEEGFAMLPRLADGEGSIVAEFSFGKKKKTTKEPSGTGALSRADFLLKCGDERGGELLLEVKSVTLAGGEASSSSLSSSSSPNNNNNNNRLALFPDTVSVRAQRHCRDLEEAISSPSSPSSPSPSSPSTNRRRAAILFLIQRADCDSFAPSDECDRDYARALRSAAAAGVSVLAVRGEVVVPEDGDDDGEGGKKGIRFRYLGRARVDLGSDVEEEEEEEEVEEEGEKGFRANKRKK